jgi:hypothetical protein
VNDPLNYLTLYGKTLQAQLDDFLKDAQNVSANVVIGYSSEYVLVTIKALREPRMADVPIIYSDPDNSPIAEVKEYLIKHGRGRYFCEVFHPHGVGLRYGDLTEIAKELNPKLFTHDQAVKDFWKLIGCYWAKAHYWHEGQMITRSLRRCGRLGAKDRQRLTSVIKRMLSGRGVLLKERPRNRDSKNAYKSYLRKQASKRRKTNQ